MQSIDIQEEEKALSLSVVPVQAEDRVLQEEEAIRHFTLEGILPQGHLLALHRPLGILVDLSRSGEEPRMSASQQFTFSELCVLLPLLEAYPHYCPYEVLLAYFTSASESVDRERVEQCRLHLHRSLLEGIFEQEMRPVRNVISRTRLKLHLFGVDVISLLETGYLLRKMPKRPRKPRVKQAE